MPTLENIARVIEKIKTTPRHLSENAKNSYRIALEKYSAVQTLIMRTLDIVQAAKVPELLNEGFNSLVEKYLEMQRQMLWLHELLDTDRVNSTFNQIDIWHRDFFEISSSNRNLMIINAIANFDTQIAEKHYEELFKIELEHKKLNDDLITKQEMVDEILKKLENPSAERVLSDYSQIYETDSKINDSIASKWLKAGITLIIVFVVGILSSIFCDWFPTIMKLENINDGKISSHEIINVPVLLTKTFLISLILYAIVFCFKQYSIFKNLYVVNQQKMNAFNSYRMFEAAIGEGDTEAKKALLMSLAKTIHESVNTGFLSSKDSQMPNINKIDIGKLAG